MFISPIVTGRYKKHKPLIIKALSLIDKGCFVESTKILTEIGITKEIKEYKEQNSTAPEIVLNEFFVLDLYIKFLIGYADLWKQIRDQKFNESWNLLQDEMDFLRKLKQFSAVNEEYKHLSFFESQFIHLEKIYPYKLFLSTSMTIGYLKCNICELDMDSPNCPHLTEKLYRGEIAYGIVQGPIIPDHIAIVENPADKRCIINPQEDKSEAFKLLRDIAILLKEEKLRPMGFELKITSKVFENKNYKSMGRNQECFCGSGKKFKKCCINKKTVDGIHVDIIINSNSVSDIMSVT